MDYNIHVLGRFYQKLDMFYIILIIFHILVIEAAQLSTRRGQKCNSFVKVGILLS